MRGVRRRIERITGVSRQRYTTRARRLAQRNSASGVFGQVRRDYNFTSSTRRQGVPVYSRRNGARVGTMARLSG